MAYTRADETAADAPGRGTAGRDEAAKKGAEGIQDIEQYDADDTEDHQMKTPDGPDASTEQQGGTPTPEKAAGTKTAPKPAVPEPAAEAAGEAKPAPAQDLREDAPAAEDQHAHPADGATDAVPPEKTHTDGTDSADAADGTGSTDEAGEELDGFELETEPRKRSFVGQGAGAVVAAALGVVSLTGGWLGTVAGARQSLVGQLQTSQGASVSKQIQAVYGDQWHAIALVAGAFALVGLIVGVAVLVTPAFGEPGEAQPAWIKSVSWAGVVLGVIGLLLAVLKYSDALLGMPSVSS
jgi:hypothetical protein